MLLRVFALRYIEHFASHVDASFNCVRQFDLHKCSVL